MDDSTSNRDHPLCCLEVTDPPPYDCLPLVRHASGMLDEETGKGR